MRKVVYILAIVILLLIFGISAFQVGSYYLEAHEQAERFDALAEIKNNAKNEAVTKETVPEATFGAVDIRDENGMLKEYAEIYALNQDLVGWLRIDGTVIDYPVMQTPDSRDFYLKRDFEKNHSERGCIYIREECDINKPSDNITIYGHNMLDGSMFAYLHEYTKQETWENNPLIIFDTLYEYRVYKIFAVFKTSANLGEGFSYHQMVDAQSEEEFNEFIGTCKDLSRSQFYDTGITPVYGDKIICLSTCEYTMGNGNGRLVVAAYRIS